MRAGWYSAASSTQKPCHSIKRLEQHKLMYRLLFAPQPTACYDLFAEITSDMVSAVPCMLQ